jgi:hypothetical protein
MLRAVNNSSAILGPRSVSVVSKALIAACRIFFEFSRKPAQSLDFHP